MTTAHPGEPGRPGNQAGTGPPGTPMVSPPAPGGGKPFFFVVWAAALLLTAGLVAVPGLLLSRLVPEVQSRPDVAADGSDPGEPGVPAPDPAPGPVEPVPSPSPPDRSTAAQTTSSPTFESQADAVRTGQWILVLDSKDQDTWTLDEVRRLAREQFGSRVQVIDSTQTPGLNAGYWAIVYGSFSTEDRARDGCSEVGLTPSGACYPRYIG